MRIIGSIIAGLICTGANLVFAEPVRREDAAALIQSVSLDRPIESVEAATRLVQMGEQALPPVLSAFEQASDKLIASDADTTVREKNGYIVAHLSWVLATTRADPTDALVAWSLAEGLPPPKQHAGVELSRTALTARLIAARGSTSVGVVRSLLTRPDERAITLGIAIAGALAREDAAEVADLEAQKAIQLPRDLAMQIIENFSVIASLAQSQIRLLALSHPNTDVRIAAIDQIYEGSESFLALGKISRYDAVAAVRSAAKNRMSALADEARERLAESQSADNGAENGDMLSRKNDISQAAGLAAKAILTGTPLTDVLEQQLPNVGMDDVWGELCRVSERDTVLKGRLQQELVGASPSDRGEILKSCPQLVDRPEFAAQVLALQLAAAHDRYRNDIDLYGLDNLVAQAVFAPRGQEGIVAALIRLVRQGDEDERKWAVMQLGQFGAKASPALPALRQMLAHPDQNVRYVAAEAILNTGADKADWNRAVREVTDQLRRYWIEGLSPWWSPPDQWSDPVPMKSLDPLYKLFGWLIEAVRNYVKKDGSETIVVTGTHIPAQTSLHPFPWPPPRTTALVAFGDDGDAPRKLLGTEDEPLGAIQRRIASSLKALDPNYQWRLFGLSGGFALMTGVEQLKEDGTPLEGDYRWMDLLPPPTNLPEYLTRLLLAPPGFYRSIVFAFTSRDDFGPSSAKLPDFSSGSLYLPNDIAAARFNTVHAVALIYTFARRPMGYPEPMRNGPSGIIQLKRTGLLTALQKRAGLP